jgi:hypothetical protein
LQLGVFVAKLRHSAPIRAEQGRRVEMTNLRQSSPVRDDLT